MKSDAALAMAAASGDRDAFDQLYRRYRADLLGIVLRQVGDRRLAEDIVQDCFQVAWRDLANLRDPASVKPWLFSIAYRGAVSHARRPAQVPPSEVADLVEDDTAARTATDRSATTVHSGGLVLRLIGAAVLIVGVAVGAVAFAVNDPQPQAPIVASASMSAPATASVTASVTAPVDTPSPTTSPSSSASQSPPASQSPSASPEPVNPPPAELSPEAQMVVLINQRRAEAGCGPVRSDEQLAQAAEAHSADMAAQGYFSHTSLDGSSPWDRAKRAGYQWASAENIAAGNATPESTMDQLMNSPGHRDNILNCQHKAVGVGRATGGPYRYYWTQLFGSR